jgi:hypothetical protein
MTCPANLVTHQVYAALQQPLAACNAGPGLRWHLHDSQVFVPCTESDEEDAPQGAGVSMARDEPRTIFRHEGSAGPTYHAVWSSVLFQDMPGAADRQPRPDAAYLLAALRCVAQEHSQWGVVMSSGGHFAAAVFAIHRHKKAGMEWAEPTMHKTFHKCGSACTFLLAVL